MSKRAPNAEKLHYLAHLSMLMKSHVDKGRKDGRGEDRRADQLRLGAPVEGCDKKRKIDLTRQILADDPGVPAAEARR
eukprot:8860329-Pyramimonas_sp.AAC.1